MILILNSYAYGAAALRRFMARWPFCRFLQHAASIPEENFIIVMEIALLTAPACFVSSWQRILPVELLNFNSSLLNMYRIDENQIDFVRQIVFVIDCHSFYKKMLLVSYPLVTI